MIDQTWMKFISTGSVRDYLSYKNCSKEERSDNIAASNMVSGSESKGGSVKEYGADHKVDGYSAICNPNR